MEFIRFPKIGANVEEGMVGTWHKAEGDVLKPSDPLVELITDKATFDLEAECAGVLRRILAPEKSTVPVAYILALVGEPGEDIPDVSAENARVMAAYRARAQTAASLADSGSAPQPHAEAQPAAGAGAKASSGAQPKPAGSSMPARVRAMPAARRMARKAGIDIATLQPAPGRQVITEEDVKRFLEGSGLRIQERPGGAALSPEAPCEGNERTPHEH